MRRRLLALLIVIAISGSTGGAALAATGPGAQKAGIVSAMRALVDRADRNKFDFTGIKVTSVPDKVWAIAFANPKPAFQATIQSFYALLLHVPNRRSQYHWIVADFGNAFVGCGVASLDVLKDLTGDADPCPPGAFGRTAPNGRS